MQDALPPAPRITKVLVEWLSQAFPDRLPTSPDRYEDYLGKVGEQRVIRRLREEHERQLEKSLNP